MIRVHKRDGTIVTIDDQGTTTGPVKEHIPARDGPCISLGDLLDRTACGGEVYHCKRYGTCTTTGCCGHDKNAMQDCRTCGDYTKAEIPVSGIAEDVAKRLNRVARPAIKFTPRELAPFSFGVRLNPSLMPWKDGYLFAYRNSWLAARISVIQLTRDFYPESKRSSVLYWNHLAAVAGMEDARLFLFNGWPHVSFTGWMGMNTSSWNKANVLYGRLNQSLTALEAVYYPQIPGRRAWEKNHVYFEPEGGKLHAVYSIVPHRVLRISGEKVEHTYETPLRTSWQYGHLRGGASPVLHQGRYYHFFHGMRERGPGNGRLYSMGVCVFEAKPPFRVLKITHRPLDVADHKTNPGINSDVIFPGGASYHDGVWSVAMGVHDSWSEIRFYPERTVEALLERV